LVKTNRITCGGLLGVLIINMIHLNHHISTSDELTRSLILVSLIMFTSIFFIYKLFDIIQELKKVNKKTIRDCGCIEDYTDGFYFHYCDKHQPETGKSKLDDIIRRYKK